MDGYDGTSHRGVNANQRHRHERPSPDRWGHVDIDSEPPAPRPAQPRTAKYIPPRGRTSSSWEHDNRGQSDDIEPYTHGFRSGNDSRRGGEYVAPRGGFRSDYDDRGRGHDEPQVRGGSYRGHDDRSQGDGYSARTNYDMRMHSDAEHGAGQEREDRGREGDRYPRGRAFQDGHEERRGYGNRRADGYSMTSNQYGYDRAEDEHHSSHGMSPGSGGHSEMAPRSRGQNRPPDKVDRPPSNERNMTRGGKSKRPDVQVYVPRGRRSMHDDNQSQADGHHSHTPTSPPVQQQQQQPQSKRQGNKESTSKRKSNPGGNVDYHQDWSKELEEEPEKKGKGKKKLQPIEVYVPRPKRQQQEESAFLLDPTDNWEDLADEDVSPNAETKPKIEDNKKPGKKGEEGKKREKKKNYDRDARLKQKNSTSRHGNHLLDAFTIDDVSVPNQVATPPSDASLKQEEAKPAKSKKKRIGSQSKPTESVQEDIVAADTSPAQAELSESNASVEAADEAVPAGDGGSDSVNPVIPEAEEDVMESWEDMADEDVAPSEPPVTGIDNSIPSDSKPQAVSDTRSHPVDSSLPPPVDSSHEPLPADDSQKVDTEQVAIASDSQTLCEVSDLPAETDTCQHPMEHDNLDDSADLNIDAEVQAWIESESAADDVPRDDTAVENAHPPTRQCESAELDPHIGSSVDAPCNDEVEAEKTVAETDTCVAMEDSPDIVNVPNHVDVTKPCEPHETDGEITQAENGTCLVDNEMEVVCDDDPVEALAEDKTPQPETATMETDTVNANITPKKHVKKTSSKPVSDTPEEKPEAETKIKLEVRPKPKKKKRVPKEDGPTFSKNKKENAVLNDIWETFGRGNEEEGSGEGEVDAPVEPVVVTSPPKIKKDDSDDDWDTMFDDNGDALDSAAVEELTSAIGHVKVEKTQFDYYNYQPKDPELDDETYGHLIEIYDFPTEFQTRDLLVIFKGFLDRGFDIKWVDDSHAIGMFASSLAAKEALELKHPLLKLRPISVASRQTKLKTKKNSDFLEPYKPRPETTAHVARNLVANALGLKTRVPKEKRDEERKKLKEAKEKKRATTRQKDDAWEGNIGMCAMDQ